MILKATLGYVDHVEVFAVKRVQTLHSRVVCPWTVSMVDYVIDPGPDGNIAAQARINDCGLFALPEYKNMVRAGNGLCLALVSMASPQLLQEVRIWYIHVHTPLPQT